MHPQWDDIASNRTEMHLWGEKIFFSILIYKAYTYVQVYLWYKNVIGKAGTIREKMFTKFP